MEYINTLTRYTPVTYNGETIKTQQDKLNPLKQIYNLKIVGRILFSYQGAFVLIS
ncbi:hypothetical protein [[Mycoplasma] imitans]|uniref:hypothetical protein n=1 Tax=[Mycoplasma] imitans TaxID=29560 RepID=UPI0004B7E95E|nr:hypothetical protein [[Mycoplasma] imitans]